MRTRFFVEPRTYRRGIFGCEPWRISVERGLRWAGVLLLGWCGWTLAQARAYQGYESWALDRARAGRKASVGAYLASRVGIAPAVAPSAAAPPAESAVEEPEPAAGDPLGRLEIPRLHLSAVVLEGDDDRTLKLGVGHVPGTALPDRPGNVALAAHRDSFFRPLRGIRASDAIEMTTAHRTYRYRVDSVSIVGPDDVAVLRDSGRPSLTLVTCYPFWWVGNAPKRFVVRASRVEAR